VGLIQKVDSLCDDAICHISTVAFFARGNTSHQSSATCFGRARDQEGQQVLYQSLYACRFTIKIGFACSRVHAIDNDSRMLRLSLIQGIGKFSDSQDLKQLGDLVSKDES
jgi:hypothetical protein